jgi:hypothetical protein
MYLTVGIVFWMNVFHLNKCTAIFDRLYIQIGLVLLCVYQANDILEEGSEMFQSGVTKIFDYI